MREKAIDSSSPVAITPSVCEPYSSHPFPEGWVDIDPFKPYRLVFNGELYTVESPELILTRGRNGDKGDLETNEAVTNLIWHQMPSFCGGWNIHGMTRKQYDAYDMVDGTPYSRETTLEKYGNEQFTTKNNVKLYPYNHLPNSGIWLGYANREPRFYISVAYGGSIWYRSSSQENIYKDQQALYHRGEDNGRVNSNERWANADIGITKYVHPDDCTVGNGSFIRVKVEPTLRYVDIPLPYAETSDNLTTSRNTPTWDGEQTYTVSCDIQQTKHGVTPVRVHAGVPDYFKQTYASRDAFFRVIVYERQIEPFDENQRSFDLRHWKVAGENEAEQVYGYNTSINREHRTQFYAPARVPNLQASFSRKQCFQPITYIELK